MNKDSNCNIADFAKSAPSLDNKSLTNESLANETTRLLSELDRAIDHSSALRNIIMRQEALLELESITGVSRKTQTLRQEIARLEQQLYAASGDNAAASDPSLSPV